MIMVMTETSPVVPSRSKTAGVWTGGAAILLVYLTDWKVVLGRIPIVRNRFKDN